MSPYQEQLLVDALKGVGSAPPTTLVATIAAGQSLSGTAFVNGKLAAIIMPSVWTAAAITFSVSTDGLTWADLYDDGVERSISSANAVAGRFLALPLINWLAVKYVRVRSGAAAAPVNQSVSVFSLVLAG